MKDKIKLRVYAREEDSQGFRNKSAITKKNQTPQNLRGIGIYDISQIYTNGKSLFAVHVDDDDATVTLVRVCVKYAHGYFGDEEYNTQNFDFTKPQIVPRGFATLIGDYNADR